MRVAVIMRLSMRMFMTLFMRMTMHRTRMLMRILIHLLIIFLIQLPSRPLIAASFSEKLLLLLLCPVKRPHEVSFRSTSAVVMVVEEEKSYHIHN